MPTAVVSDLHLGTVTGADVARLPEARERLIEAVREADQVVVLGDLLELRERPAARVLELARPVVEGLGAAMAGRRVVLVPGNHDHQLAEPWIARADLDHGRLPLESTWRVEPRDGLAGRMAEWMPETELVVAYPGLFLRPDVYATHGHYLDVHMTVPRIEAVAASLMARVTGREAGGRSAADYEAVLAPLYAFFDRLVQGGAGQPLRRGGRMSRTVWDQVNSEQGSRLRAFLLGGVTIPAAVAVLNRAGIGHFEPDISMEALRRGGLEAMATVVRSLGIETPHVLFGHTHRPGPWPDDGEGWATPDGRTRLWNTGSWLYEPVLLRDAGPENPYWPGAVLRLPEDGPPELANVLSDVTVRATRVPGGAR